MINNYTINQTDKLCRGRHAQIKLFSEQLMFKISS